ncbi:acid protease [Boletus edulis]|nr:acid protease [Boletus edulis]
MFSFKAFLPLILITSTAVDAIFVSRRTGKTTLSFATKINELGTLNVAERDRARAQAMKQGGQLGQRSSIMDSNTGVNYVVQVGIGSPATNYTLLLDTGSGNTWVGAGKPYVPTKTSRNTGEAVSVSYGSGSFSGEEWIDTITLSPSLVIRQQSIGVTSQASGIAHGLDGILGLGPINLTMGTVNGMNTVPTVSDNLHSQGTISKEVLGVYFIPESSSTTKSGELMFGGYDHSTIVGPVFYVPLTKTQLASDYWGIEQSISYGDDIIQPSTAGIIDTGTTLILIATNAFQEYKNMTGGTPDSVTGLLKITSEQYDNLKPLVFIVGSEPFVLTPNAQIWPRSLNTAIGGSADAIYLIVSDIGSPSGSGLDFVNGYTFLERFYSVYDTTKQSIGLAHTKFTFSENN